MRINFLVPCKDFAGGLKVVAAYGNALVRRGHSVRVLYPKRKETFRKRIKNRFNQLIYQERDHLDYFVGDLIQIPDIRERYMPEADKLIVTSWETAECAKAFSEVYGEKYYLIQHYETWSGEKEKVDRTFQYPFKKIVISQWLEKIVTERCSQASQDVTLIPNGRDFYFSEARGEGIKRKYDVGMLYSRVKFKKSEVGVEAIRLLKKRYPKIKCVMFGSEYPRQDLSGLCKFYRRPSQEFIRQIYLDTRMWISSSELEGFCLPALEAISLGSVVVATNSLGIEDIIVDKINGRLVEVNNPKAISNAVAEIMENNDLEKRYRIEGFKKSEQFSWIQAATDLENILKE